MGTSGETVRLLRNYFSLAHTDSGIFVFSPGSPLDCSMTAKSDAQKISTFGGFIAGGLAACGAVTFTNPLELVKTRMQLEGELAKRSNVAKVYKNPIQALFLILKNEGIAGAQKGLVCAYIYQLGLNGCRLGLYEPMRNFTNSLLYGAGDHSHIQNIPINVFAGAMSGIAGAIVGSPMYLVKTRMQSYSDQIKIGEQTHYRSAWDGLRQIYTAEGIRGLFRGVDAAIIRTGAGSSVQLPIYNFAKHELKKTGYFADGPGLHLVSSVSAGVGVAVVMGPADTILTRVYNQHSSNLYSGPIDCFMKTVRAEGVMALYKGFGAQVLRIGPHTVLTLTFMEQTMSFMYKVETMLAP